MKDVYDNLYSNDKYNNIVNMDQFKWLMDRELDITTAVDFGCGRGHIVHALRKSGIKTIGVDFASTLVDSNWHNDELFISGDIMAVNLGYTVDLVVCHDVLEHIKLDDINVALDNLVKHTGKFASLAIANHSDIWDGEQLHLIQEDINWWREKISARWNIIECESRLSGILHLFWCEAK